MMMAAFSTATFLRSESPSPSSDEVRNSNATRGKRASRIVLSCASRGLRERLMTVHVRIEGKKYRWRSRCASICLPAPKATMECGWRHPTRLVERREPNLHIRQMNDSREEREKFHVPAAFLNAVRFLAFRTTFTAPVDSSSTMVDAGRPRVSPEFLGTETSLSAVPCKSGGGKGETRRAGMKRAVWSVIWMVVL